MKVTDPVCGMSFDQEDAVATVEHEGTEYHFCSSDCKEEFQENPADYAD